MTIEDSHTGVEASIREAMQRGDFDDLKGRGKPLDLNEYFEAPEELRVGFSLLKNNGFMPHEIELRKEIAELRTSLTGEKDPNKRRALQRQLNNKQLAYDMFIEAPCRHRSRR